MSTTTPTWWRAVLGEYPTGVCAISTIDPETGEDVGLVVGTFAAVSEEPPMVSFMAATTSRSAKRVLESGTFCVSVFGAEHEALCRSMNRKSTDRFSEGDWVRTDGGRLRLENAAAWFDAEISQVVEAGDHNIILGNVVDYGVGSGDAGMPLLYFKGGYGSFTVPTLEFNPKGLGENVRIAHLIQNNVEELARDLQATCYVATVAKDSVLVLASANPTNSGDQVGMSFPFAAPVAPIFAAWSTPERTKLWEEHARHLLGQLDRPLLAQALARIRERGYAVSIGDPADFDAVIENADSSVADYAQHWSAVNDEYRSFDELEDLYAHVKAFQVPVFGPDGNVMLELYVSNFAPHATREEFDAMTRRAVESAAALSNAIGGVVPDDYPREQVA